MDTFLPEEALFDRALLISLDLLASFFVSGLLEIVIPFLIGFYIWRRFGASWRLFFIGGAMFLIALMREPLNELLVSSLSGSLPLEYLWVAFYALPAFTAGIFEESARFIAFKLVIKGREVSDALMYGAGHGGIESILLVGVNTLSLAIVVYFYPDQLSADQMFLVNSIPVWLPLVGLWERMVAFVIQLGLSVLVLQTLVKEKYLYFVAAIFLHFLVNIVSQVLLLQYGIFASEGVTTLFAAAFTYYIYATLKNEKAKLTASVAGEKPEPPTESAQ